MTFNTHHLLSRQAGALTLHAGGGKREEPAERNSKCSPQAASTAKSQLLGHSNRKLSIVCYVYDQKMHGALCLQKQRQAKRFRAY